MSGESLDCGIGEVCTSHWHSSSFSSSRTTTTDEFVKFATKLFSCDQNTRRIYVAKDESIRRKGEKQNTFLKISQVTGLKAAAGIHEAMM